MAAGEPVAGIALGIVVFGDRIQVTPGMLAIEAGGIAALIIGVVAVARSSAFTGLRKITEVITPHTAHVDGSAHRHEHPDRFSRRPDDPRTHRREDLNGLRPDPVDGAGPREGPAPLDAAPLDAARPRRVHRRPFHDPASGEDGG
jgi:hypothetical protein